MKDRRRRACSEFALAVVLISLVVAGCGTSASAPSASPSAPPSATPRGVPLTQAEAVARVLAQDPRFSGIGPPDANLIGQSAWYEVTAAVVGWRVTVTIGWGDCQAGCISRHSWVYDVDASGTVTPVEERGDPLADGSGGGPGAGGGVPPVAIPADGGPWIAGLAHAGPACPVERIPPDPACADRPVAGAGVTIRDTDGRVVSQAVTSPDGTFLAAVPAGGSYVIEAQPVEGLLGTPPPFEVLVGDGAAAWATADLAYDTGIR
jgi:hypothetical protein